ncbi:MAG: hypothetical protein HYY48_00820 [Gammaproteobacteria bacterium]|nr:hypothetical protein [Gammaproteobacteria bacterium]
MRPLEKSAPLCDRQTGFIHHPSGFPLEFKRIWFGGRARRVEEELHDIGLLFECDRYLPPGAIIEIRIPLRSETERFRGRVVLVRHNGECHEIGLWVTCREDAARMRIVEQICHIESYLKQKKYSEGPYTINREQIAAEWIRRYADSVPSL